MKREPMTDEPRAAGGVRWVVAALAIIAIVVVAAAFFASGDPDGLERVAEDNGFLDAARDNPFSIIGDYTFPGMDGPMATVVAGLIGVAIVLGLVWLLGRLLARRRSGTGSPEA